MFDGSQPRARAAVRRSAYTKRARPPIGAAAAWALPRYDPVFDLEGAFFPAWMLCLLVGVLATVALRLLFARVGLEHHLGPLPLIYPCLALLLTMTTWLLFFRA